MANLRETMSFSRKIRQFLDEVRADHDMMIGHREKYRSGDPTPTDTEPVPSIPRHLVTNIGFQALVGIRAMQLLRRLDVPLGKEVAARAIRHLYGMEVHWLADIAPGVSLIHGNGVVISRAAKIASGCMIFQNVTLGQSRDPATGEVGAPALGENVHIGPGATLIGPITVGEGSKIMAGAVLSHSVPSGSLVKPAPVSVTTRDVEARG